MQMMKTTVLVAISVIAMIITTEATPVGNIHGDVHGDVYENSIVVNTNDVVQASISRLLNGRTIEGFIDNIFKG